MGKVFDLSGKKLNRFTVIRYYGLNKSRKALWLCRCDCGKEVVVVGQNIRNGASKSCGCYGLEVLEKRNVDHGLSGTRLHRIWIGMRERCHKERVAGYKNYGGKGVKVHPEWSSDYLSFYTWAMNNGYKENLTLDRRDPTGDYEPGNCQWITRAEQTRNKRNTIFVEIDGVSKNLLTGAVFMALANDTPGTEEDGGKPVKKYSKTKAALESLDAIKSQLSALQSILKYQTEI